MEKIYTDMLLADQWFALNTNNRIAIDTTLFYEPIFRKYGYTTDDFRVSVEYYMRDPLRFSRMMKKVAIKMDAEAARLQNATELPPEDEPEIEIE